MPQETLYDSSLWTTLQDWATLYPPQVSRLVIHHYFQLLLSYLQDMQDELDARNPLDVVIPHPTPSALGHGILELWEKLLPSHPLRKFSIRLLTEVQPSPNPVIVIAHFLLGILPQHLYRFSSDVEEGLFAWEGDFPRITCQYAFQTHHADTLHPLVAEYRRKTANTLFFPTGALELLTKWDEISQGRLLLLVGDCGPATIEQVQELGHRLLSNPALMPAVLNFHALALWAAQQGGSCLVAKHPHPRFLLAAYLFSGSSIRYPTLTRTYQQVAGFTAEDYKNLLQYTVDHWSNPPLATLLALLKISLYDPEAFTSLAPKLDNFVPLLVQQSQLSFLNALRQVRKNTSVDQPRYTNTFFYLGKLFRTLEAKQEAQECYAIASDLQSRGRA